MAGELDKFRRGEPVNEEIAELMKDKETAPEPFPTRRIEAPWDDPGRDLTTSEREDLRHLVNQPGWKVFKHLLDRGLQQRRHSAIVSSQEDPLGDPHRVATDWAYMALWQKQLVQIDGMIELELAALRTTRLAEGKKDGEGNGRVLA